MRTPNKELIEKLNPSTVASLQSLVKETLVRTRAVIDTTIHRVEKEFMQDYEQELLELQKELDHRTAMVLAEYFYAK